MLPIKPAVSADQRRLLGAYAALDQTDKEALLAFAEFLGQRGKQDAPSPGVSDEQEPKPIPRPAEETVIDAIRRLSETYHMLEKDALLNDTSVLMSAHILQGRDAVEVIDELELLFETTYQRFNDNG